MPEAQLLHLVPPPGMKESVDKRLAPQGVLSYAQNVRFEKGGRIRKRGNAAQRGTLPSGSWSQPSWTHDDLVCLDNTVHRYSPESQQWVPVGQDCPVVAFGRFSAQLDEAQGVGSPSVAQIGGVVVVASGMWSTPGSSRVRLTGMSIDGKRLWEATVAGYLPRLLLVGSTLYCAMLPASGSGTLQYSTVSAAGVVSAPATLHAGSFTCFDVSLLEGTSNWLVATYDGSNLIRVMIFAGAVEQTFNAVTVGATVVSVTVAGNGTTNDAIWVAWNDQTNLKATAFKWDLSTTWTATTTIFAGGATSLPLGQPTILRVSASTALIALTRGGNIASAPALTYAAVRTVLFSTAAVVSRVGDTWGWCLASKFMPAGQSGQELSTATRARVWVASAALGLDWGRRNAVLDLSVTGSQGVLDGSIVALAYERAAYDAGGQLPEVCQASFTLGGTDQRVLAFTLLYWQARTFLPAVDLAVFTLRGTFTTSRENLRSLERIGPTDHVGGGGALVEVQPYPAGVTFRYLPLNGIPLLPAAQGVKVAGGTLTASTSYTYFPVYEHLDESGNRTRAVGEPFDVSTDGTNKQITLNGTVPGGLGRPGMTLHYYRAWGGGPPHRVTPDNGAPLVTDYTGACVTAGFVAFTDNIPDATAALNEELEMGAPNGALPPDPPSGCRLLTQGDGRLFVGSWDRRVVWCTKVTVPGEPAQFVDDDAFRIFFPEDLNALAYQDGALIGFGASGVYVTTGDGPTDEGANPYPEPRALPVDSGALNWWSVLTMSPGTFYESSAGLMLLPRGFGPPVFIGNDVQDTVGAAKNQATEQGVIGASRSQTLNGSELAHFLLTTGKMVTLDTRLGAWAVDAFAISAPRAIGRRGRRLAMLVGTTPTSAAELSDDAGGGADIASDGSSQWVEQRIRFGELRPFGMSGEGRFTRAAFALEGDLNVIQSAFIVQSTLDDGLDVDGQPETRTFRLGSPTGLQHGGSGGLLYLGTDFARKPGTALGLELYDAKLSDGAVSAQSWAFFGLSISVQGEDGVRDMPSEVKQ